MNRNRILLIDDDELIFDAMSAILEDDYRLEWCAGAPEALDTAEAFEPHLVLCDVHLGPHHGFDLIAQFKADPRFEDTPFIFLTAAHNDTLERKGFELGAVDFFNKNMPNDIVKARLRAHMSLVSFSKLEESYRESIIMMGRAGHFKDTDTGAHIWRMAAYAKLLALKAGWSNADAELLELAAPMHDTGKIGIPDHILKKPGPLTPEEWVVMKTHSQIGHELLAQSSAPVFQLAATVALHHHEKWDGSGYPFGLSGTDIPQAARIVAVADCFDALTMRRPYKEAWPLDKALNHLREGAGQHFDPQLVALFLNDVPQVLAIKAEWDDRE